MRRNTPEKILYIRPFGVLFVRFMFFDTFIFMKYFYWPSNRITLSSADRVKAYNVLKSIIIFLLFQIANNFLSKNNTTLWYVKKGSRLKTSGFMEGLIQPAAFLEAAAAGIFEGTDSYLLVWCTVVAGRVERSRRDKS